MRRSRRLMSLRSLALRPLQCFIENLAQTTCHLSRTVICHLLLIHIGSRSSFSHNERLLQGLCRFEQRIARIRRQKRNEICTAGAPEKLNARTILVQNREQGFTSEKVSCEFRWVVRC